MPAVPGREGPVPGRELPVPGREPGLFTFASEAVVNSGELGAVALLPALAGSDGRGGRGGEGIGGDDGKGKASTLDCLCKYTPSCHAAGPLLWCPVLRLLFLPHDLHVHVEQAACVPHRLRVQPRRLRICCVPARRVDRANRRISQRVEAPEFHAKPQRRERGVSRRNVRIWLDACIQFAERRVRGRGCRALKLLQAHQPEEVRIAWRDGRAGWPVRRYQSLKLETLSLILVAVGVIVLHERPERAPPILHHRTTRNRIWLVVADSEETRCGGRDIAKEDSEARGGICRNGMIVPRLRRGIRTRPTFAPWLALHHTLYARALSIPDVRGAEGDT